MPVAFEVKDKGEELIQGVVESMEVGVEGGEIKCPQFLKMLYGDRVTGIVEGIKVGGRTCKNLREMQIYNPGRSMGGNYMEGGGCTDESWRDMPGT